MVDDSFQAVGAVPPRVAPGATETRGQSCYGTSSHRGAASPVPQTMSAPRSRQMCAADTSAASRPPGGRRLQHVTALPRLADFYILFNLCLYFWN